ncbi:hypothetical protein GN956_G6681 [Arapaima gigas]
MMEQICEENHSWRPKSPKHLLRAAHVPGLKNVHEGTKMNGSLPSSVPRGTRCAEYNRNSGTKIRIFPDQQR